MSIGARIKQARTKKGITQDQLAKMSSLSLMSIRRYEAGERQPQIEQLQKIADALNVSIANFLLDLNELNLATPNDFDADEIELLKQATPELLSDKQREAVRIYDELMTKARIAFQKKYPASTNGGSFNLSELMKNSPTTPTPFNAIKELMRPVFSEDETNLLVAYRNLSEQSKEYVRNTIKLLQEAHKQEGNT